MRIITLDDRPFALGLLWFGRASSGAGRRQARGLARRLGWNRTLVFAERSGSVAQLGLAPRDVSLPGKVGALAPACVATDAGDLLVRLRLDDTTGWILAVRRGHVLVDGDRVVPWEDHARVFEELRAHLEEPRTVIEDDRERSRSLLKTLVREPAPSLETLVFPPWTKRGRWIAALPLVAACVFILHSWSSRPAPHRRALPPTAAARVAFLHLWREGRSPRTWRRLCLRPLLALSLVRRGRKLETLTCTTEGLVARYRPLVSSLLSASSPTHGDRRGEGTVSKSAPKHPWASLPHPLTLSAPAIADGRVARLLAVVGLSASRTFWRPCLDPHVGRPERFLRLRCRSLRVRMRREPEARLRLLLRALTPAATVRIRRLVARLSPPSWTLEATLYAEQP